MHKSRQLEGVQLEVLTFVTHKAREDGEEVKDEVASEIVPGGLAECPVVSVDFEKGQACIQYEEYVIHELKNFHSRIVLRENQSKNRT